MFRISFLEPKLVFHYFEVFLLSSKPNDHRLTQFSNYLLNNYISIDASFPLNIWAAVTADLNITTNACESFHSHFNKSFNSNHFHIFLNIGIVYCAIKFIIN